MKTAVNVVFANHVQTQSVRLISATLKQLATSNQDKGIVTAKKDLPETVDNALVVREMLPSLFVSFCKLYKQVWFKLAEKDRVTIS